MAKQPEFDITGALEGEVLVVRFSGHSTPENSRAMARRYFDVILASGRKKVLADLRSLNGRLSTGETYFLLRDLPVKPVPRGIRTAILESEDQSKFATFLETTANNAGLGIRCFSDREKALAWLQAP
jgi:hypothetical protein